MLHVSRRLGCACALACMLIVIGSLPAGANASVSIGSFSAVPSTTQAGGHPDIAVRFGLSSREVDPSPCSCDDAKDVDIHLPPGLIGNPHATPQCSLAAFAAEQCPIDSQVGVVAASVSISSGIGTGHGIDFVAPVFSLIPPPGEAALLGFKSSQLDTPTFEVVSPRTSTDYGLDFATDSIEHIFPLDGFEQLTWGIPAAPIHDYLRFGLGQPPTTYGSALGGPQPPTFCNQNGEASGGDPASVFQLCAQGERPAHPVGAGPQGPGGPVPSQSPETPFLQGPTTCGENSLTTSMDVLSYDGGESHANGTWPATTDCTQLSFNPSQAIEPTTTAADSPSGAEAHLTIPQFESPSVPSPSELKAATITLPQGFSLAPNVTNGKVACSEAEAKIGAYGSTEAGHCPENSKIGTISVETPVLPGPLLGAAYLGESKPGQRFRVFLLFDGFGVHIKLPGVVTPDPTTGQIRLEFQSLPQAPFADFNLHIFGSERGPLDTPTHCGTYEVTSEWVPWDSALPNQTSSQFFVIDEGPGGTPCPGKDRPFSPGFQAASAVNTAGAHTSFAISLLREDGEQNLGALKVTTPAGFTAALKGLTYCPDAVIAAAALETHAGLAEQADPSCPASSYVGELVAAAGPGSHPLYLPGRVYLAGPYQGAPLSFALITPAVSGGYDLGDVVVREALHINPETAQVTAGGAELPQIFQGIPLRLRQVFINLNRPDFALNPTNCNPQEVKAEVFGTEGAVSNSNEHFQVANCAALSFKPRLAIGLTGSTKQTGNPTLTATLTAKSGEANISRTQVTLPHTELVDNAHISDPCTRVQFAEGHNPGEKCPPGSVLGFARAETPLLAKSLEGPIYLRATGRAGLPDIVATLNGQIDITLDGHVDAVHGRLRTTFETVPDAPVSRVFLNFDGGHRGIIENSPGVCAHPLHVIAKIAGQNGKTANQNPVLSTPCGTQHRKRAHLYRNWRGAR
ncbi:MAG: hypothetical protein WB507_08190 [Solirubrobacterales bacterium]